MMIERRETEHPPLPTPERATAKRPGEGACRHPSPQAEGSPGTLGAPHIRRATEADLPACADIINDYVDATGWLPRVKSREEIAGLFTANLLHARIVLVAEMGGEIGGYLTLTPEGEIPALYLAPRFRGLGLGKMLVDGAKEEHPAYLELKVFEPNRAAKRFYEREGFREVPERRNDETDEGVPTLLMRWRGAA